MQFERLIRFISIFLTLFLLSLTWWTFHTAWKFREADWQLGNVDSSMLFWKAVITLGLSVFLGLLVWKKLVHLQGCFLLTLVFLVIFAEIGLRLSDFSPALFVERTPQNQYLPYIMYTNAPGRDEGYPISKLGYRDEVPMPKPVGEYRVIVIGGSTVMDYTLIDRDDTLVGILDEQLAPQVRFYNWGVRGAVSAQELITVLLRAIEYQPDMIITYDGINDLYLSYYYDPRPGYTRNFMATEAAHRIMRGEYGIFDLYALFFNKSAFGSLVYYPEITEQLLQWIHLLEISGHGTAEWRSQLVASYINPIRKICILSEAFDFEYIAFLQPMIFFKDHLTSEERITEHSDEAIVSHTFATYETAREQYQALGAEYEECAFYDISRVFEKTTTSIFLDNMHLNREGNALMAEALLPFIERHLE